MRELLDNDDVKSDLGKVRFGFAMVAMTVLVWMSYARIFAERAVRQSAKLAVSLTFFALSAVMYRAVLAGYERFVSTLIERAIGQARKRTDVSDRVALAIGFAVGAAAAYAAYRVGRWAIRPHVERMKMYEEMYGHDALSVFEDDEQDDEDGDITGEEAGVEA